MKGMKITWAAVLVALTVIGAAIKVPAVIGSVALDAFPALLGAALFGGPIGAVVGGMGHLLSALMGGLPMGPFHLIVAAEMALLAYVFAYLYRKGRKWTAAALFVLGNAFAAPLPFLYFMGEAFYLAIVPSLFIGSLLNTVIAIIVIPRLAKVIEPMLSNIGAAK
ncbi:putative membrane protein [Cytobacillus horneckiae]|uniref:ECF transporter S component n=2 Tax=Cytobacillus horneckiae TaxID=549687 RepID=A0A2N0ZJP8_9BACI|nr:ECF transporter S component [Cytobacillus horneckiae]NRG47022.1 ECF transporter S component [Bacillus sp. CRN 9]MBN6888600.1 ECF transporter S component [Cytobacillus horneckiae]MCM3180506.1 ECF transporter S component [Cytobacillus horneckiae]MEC1158883.1 ECF transporter S component [Cytobacillus horneckiae]MED2938696.1 ECF transporter S component [Cytobacillus horneckiae]